VYAYGGSPSFPASTFQSSNYWVDVVFATGAATGTPPSVTTITPANGAAGISASTTVTATFSQAMNAATINPGTFTLVDTTTGTTLSATVAYNSTNQRATLTPGSPLRAGVRYAATVKGGTGGVQSATGLALAADRAWSFTVETTPPTVTATSPANGATGVARTVNVTATFSEAMDASSINASTFELRNSVGQVVTGTVTYSTSNRRAILNPAATLAALGTYTVTVKGGANGTKDVAGNPLTANVSWSFTTR
jgi:hypothetical protein